MFDDTKESATRKINDASQSSCSSEVTYRPVPHEMTAEEARVRPVWRVRFELASDPNKWFGLDINGEIVLGRDLNTPNLIDLGAYDAYAHGVSRRHLMLSPTHTNLFVVDLASTNGTRHNGRPLDINEPHILLGGDTLTLGRLKLVIRILARPSLQTAPLTQQPDSSEPAQTAGGGDTNAGEEWGRQRVAIQATAEALSQPLLILDEQGNVLIANQTAQEILASHMAQLFDGLSRGVGRTSELAIGDKTYLSTVEHVPEMGTIVVMQDITDAKQLEEQRSEFIHALSHDLKNPLMSITGWTEVMKRVLSLDEEGHEYVKQIVSSADQMLEMVNQLLQVARGEAITLEKDPCHLAQVVSRTLTQAEGAALNKSITLAFEQNGQPYPILADGRRLYHMVLNLVDNAIKYSPGNTRVVVKLSFGHEAVTLQVQDEGPGIPAEELPHVFDKYYRGQTTREPGTGLGLSLVKAIAEAHDGRVTAQNRPGPGGGAQFTVTLPGNLRLNTGI